MNDETSKDGGVEQPAPLRPPPRLKLSRSASKIRAKFPELARFVQAVAFQDGDVLFESTEDAIRFVYGERWRAAFDDYIVPLKHEAARFAKLFPQADSSRQRAWWDLGANVGSQTFIQRILVGIEKIER